MQCSWDIAMGTWNLMRNLKIRLPEDGTMKTTGTKVKNYYFKIWNMETFLVHQLMHTTAQVHSAFHGGIEGVVWFSQNKENEKRFYKTYSVIAPAPAHFWS